MLLYFAILPLTNVLMCSSFLLLNTLVICKQGEPATGVYFIKSGKAKLVKDMNVTPEVPCCLMFVLICLEEKSNIQATTTVYC